RDPHGGAWREFPAALSAAGGTPVAVEAVERVGAQRPARRRAVRAGRPAPEPGLLSPAPAARRWACLDAPQRSRRPRLLLRPRSGALRRAAVERGRVAAPGPGADSAPTRRARARLRTGAGAVLVHRQQRALADRRGARRA